MEKLVKLLNEYEREKQGLPKDFEDYTMWDIVGNEIVQSSCDPDSWEYFKYYIISKDYQFIKWLVDNDKIDRLTFCTVETPSSKYEDFDLGPETPREDYTNILLMDLAIQDNPIEFLISILK